MLPQLWNKRGGGDPTTLAKGIKRGEVMSNIDENKSAFEGTVVVAASDSLKGPSDYICDGIDDQVEIQAALDTAIDYGRPLVLLKGTYCISNYYINPLSGRPETGKVKMEAKDTVMKPEELRRIPTAKYTESQVEISFKVGERVGIKKVVEWLEKYSRNWESMSMNDQIAGREPTKIITIELMERVWQDKLKEWGIEK